MDGTVYASSQDTRVYALDRQTGRVQWQRKLDESVYLSVGNEILFGGSFGMTVALDPATGDLRWERDVNSRWPLFVHNQAVYAGDEIVTALDPQTGKTQWTFETAGPTMGQPTVIDGILCVASNVGQTHPADEGMLYGLDADSGQVRWQQRTTRPFVSATVGADGAAFVASVVNDEPTDVVRSFDTATGATRWEYRFDGNGSIFTSPLYSGDSLLVAGDKIYAFDPATGTQRWTVDFRPYAGALYNGTAHFYDTTSYKIIDPASGTVQRTFQFRDMEFSRPTPPAIADETTYFGARDGYLRAVWRRDS